MSSFSSLMALSRSQTSDQQASVQKALLDRQRREQEQRKKAEEQQKRQKALEQKLLLKHFEDEKKEKEKQRKREEEERAREAARQRRAEEQKNVLLYGPKKASKLSGGSSSSSQPRDAASRRKRLDDDDDDSGPTGAALTREELREKKLQAALKRSVGASRSSTISRTYHKHGGRLPGGAVDMTLNPLDAGSSSSGRSVRERLAAMPNTLTKLNTNKRDTRTIDEILQDRAKAKEHKTLDGEDAKEFNDWFGDGKKDRLKSHATSATTTPRALTPMSSSPAPLGVGSHKQSIVKRTTPPATKALSGKTNGFSKDTSRGGSADRDRPSMSKASASRLSTAPPSRPSSVPSFKKKRPRSPSPDRYPSKRRASPPPSSRHKRREYSEELDDANVSNMIWEIMGKKRSDYVHDDIFSDEEDMEAGASDLEREEMRSARIAKREDVQAMEAEKRHEEEKRRRKKERERGY
ncbi:hypothetical protein V5O48_004010 [Marasmius crinis-equi]|uniref:SPT2 chromatin protein n=1 Tax=Marasmius crinis-equi TaxID=585013 RepID=A0ABR3FRA5_9AGAR